MAYVTSEWGGEGGPPGTPATQLTLLKEMIDWVLAEHWDEGQVVQPLEELHVYNQIAFVRRPSVSAR
jgi:hypothetical protein